MAEWSDDSSSSVCSTPPVGFALCYYAYSTWRGTCLYLEDLYVQSTERGRGVGMALMRRCIREAKLKGCARVQFQALDWNQPALDFYKSIGASETREWVPIRFEKDDIDRFLNKFDAESSNQHTQTPNAQES